MEPKTRSETPRASTSPGRRNVSRSLLLEVAHMLDAASSWALFSHQKLDGDAMGTATALAEAGRLKGKRVRWMGTDPLPPAYLFLSNVESYELRKEYRFEGTDELFVILDSSNEDRGVGGLRERSPEAVILNIDHHEDNTFFGSLNCVDPSASSTSELLWRVMKTAGWTITPRIAESLYTGIVADTGGFMFSNTTRRTHLAAANLLRFGVDPSRIHTHMHQARTLAGMRLWGVALKRMDCWGEDSQFSMTWLTREDFKETGAIEADTEMLVGQLLLVRGVRFAVLLTEMEDQVKASFRSKEGMIPAALIARSMGGGGHPRASGAKLSLSLESAVELVRSTLDSAYAEWNSSGK